MRPIPALLLPALILGAPTDPASVEVQARLPEGGRATLRVQFKKGVLVEADRLPRRFLPKGNSPREGWLAFEGLSPEGKRWALEALFPSDEWGRNEVRHFVRWPRLESLWFMASLFTGHGQNYDKLQATNPKNPEKLRAGDLWRIPYNLLSPEFGGRGTREPDRSQPEDDLNDEAKVAAYRALLSFERDAAGDYAAYHLRKGEALYSSVVMRYTDRVSPREVNEMALEIARRSGIPDVRGIQPGQLVKIPVGVLADPFQPEGTKALAEEREVREEIRHTAKVDAGPRLKGLRVVLDAGHGGVDRGASANGVWESDFVYDITMRVRKLLEQDTEAQVSSTIRYPAFGFRTRDAITAPAKAAEILTTPPFANDGESPNAVSVHLRWVLANDLFSAFEKKGDPQKTLFISFHADSLHPSARGTMVYVPGAASVPSSFALAPSRGGGVQEMQRSARVAFTAKGRLQAEARSRLFSETLLDALKRDSVPVHSNRPIRNIIHRDGKGFVPAVIRYNRASTKILVEVANLQNEDDAENLKDAAFRERYAAAVVKGIRTYFQK